MQLLASVIARTALEAVLAFVPPRDIGTLHTEKPVAYFDLAHAQILQDRVELLQNIGEAYDEAELSSWAWEVLLDQHPELMPEEAWLG